eukprot:gene9488-10479_t
MTDAAKTSVNGIVQSDLLLNGLRKNKLNVTTGLLRKFDNKKTNLFDVIFIAENMRNQQGNTHENSWFVTDLGYLTNCIVEEVVLHSGNSAQDKSRHPIDHTIGKHGKFSQHEYLIDEIMLSLESNFQLKKGLTVITDQSELGEVAQTRILQRSIEAKRQVLKLGTISKTSGREEIQQLLGGDIYIVDSEGPLTAKLLQFAKEAGYTGYPDGVSWIFTSRTKDSLPPSFTLPEGKYYGLHTDMKEFNAQTILETVAQCKHDNEASVTCKRAKHRIAKVKFVQLLTKDYSSSVEREWVEILSTEETNNNVIRQQHKNPLWPLLKVAVSDTFPPWIHIVDFAKTYTKEPYCGNSGKPGFRYLNSTSNLTVPICAYGFAVSIVDYLTEKHGINCDIHVSRDGLYGGYNETSGTANGLVEEIMNGNADIAVDMLEEPSRRKALEFTKPYEVSYHGIAYIRNSQSNSDGVLSPFSDILWAAIASVIVVIVLAAWLLERVSPFGQKQKNKRTMIKTDYIFGISESMEYIWGTICCGEIIQEKPSSTACRVASIFLSFSFIIIVALYSANLITSFVVVDETPLVTGLKDPKILSPSSKYKIGTQTATATSNFLSLSSDTKVREMSKRLVYCDSYDECIKALKDRKIDFFFSDYLSLTTTAAKIDSECTFKVVKVESDFGGLGISFKKGSPWKRKLNLAAVGMVDSGRKDQLVKFWFGDGKCKPINQFFSLDKKHFAKLFIWLFSGIISCFSILFVTHAWKLVNKCYVSVTQVLSSPS